MNSITTAAPTALATAAARPASHSTWSIVRRAIAALLLAATLVTGNAALAPTQADAGTGAHVSFCFRYQDGYRPVNIDVTLRRYYPSTGNSQVVRTGKTNSRGCGVFYNVDLNRHYVVHLGQFVGDLNACYAGYSRAAVTLTGASPLYVTPTWAGSGNHYVGMATVQEHWWC